MAYETWQLAFSLHMLSPIARERGSEPTIIASRVSRNRRIGRMPSTFSFSQYVSQRESISEVEKMDGDIILKVRLKLQHCVEA